MIVTFTTASSFLVSETVPWAQRWIRCAGHQARRRPWEGRETRGSFLPHPLSTFWIQCLPPRIWPQFRHTCAQHQFASHGVLLGREWHNPCDSCGTGSLTGTKVNLPLSFDVCPHGFAETSQPHCWKWHPARADAGQARWKWVFRLHSACDAARRALTVSSSSQSNCFCCRAQQLQKKREGKPSVGCACRWQLGGVEQRTREQS